MPNYLPLTEPGTVRVRAKRVEMINTADQVPYLIWHKENQILLLDGTCAYSPADILMTYASEENLSEEFPLIDPDTGESRGSMTGEELLNAVQSYFMFKDQQSASGD